MAHSDEQVSQWIAETLIPSNQLILAEQDRRICGMMAWSKEDNIVWIDQLYLLPSMVSNRLGDLFINYAKTVLDSPLQLYTFQENIRAKRFYERHGFQIIATSDGSTNEEHCPDLLYEWR